MTQGGKNSNQAPASSPSRRTRPACASVVRDRRHFARDHPAIHLDPAPVGHDVDALPPLDPSDREARRAEHGVRPGGRQVGRITGQRRDDVGHAIDRVDAELGRRAVAGHSPDADLPAHRALVVIDHVEPGRLRHDRQVGAERGCCQLRGAGVRELFIDRASHDHRRRSFGPFAHQPRKGHEHRRHPALDVTRPAAVQPPPLDRGRERRDRHPIGGHRVLMGIEEERGPAPGRLVSRDQVIAPCRDRPPLTGDAQLAKPALEVVGHPRFKEPRAAERPAHRVHTRGCDEVQQQASHVIHGFGSGARKARLGSRPLWGKRGERSAQIQRSGRDVLEYDQGRSSQTPGR